jgi:hypothetical protein
MYPGADTTAAAIPQQTLRSATVGIELIKVAQESVTLKDLANHDGFVCPNNTIVGAWTVPLIFVIAEHACWQTVSARFRIFVGHGYAGDIRSSYFRMTYATPSRNFLTRHRLVWPITPVYGSRGSTTVVRAPKRIISKKRSWDCFVHLHLDWIGTAYVQRLNAILLTVSVELRSTGIASSDRFVASFICALVFALQFETLEGGCRDGGNGKQEDESPSPSENFHVYLLRKYRQDYHRRSVLSIVQWAPTLPRRQVRRVSTRHLFGLLPHFRNLLRDIERTSRVKRYFD